MCRQGVAVAKSYINDPGERLPKEFVTNPPMITVLAYSLWLGHRCLGWIATLEYSEFNSSANDTIVFLHGAGIGGWMWKPNIQHLTHFHCIAVDFPGHGESHGLPWNSFEDTAKGVARLITEKGKNGVAHVVGLSLGGYIALTLLKIAPHVVRRTLISGVQIGKMPYARLIELSAYAIAPFLHYQRLILMNAKGLRVPQKYIPDYVKGAKQFSKQSYLAIIKEAVNFEFSTEDFPRNKDVLLLAGAREHQRVLSSLNYFQRLNKVISFIVDDVGHAWSIEAPELFSEVVHAWITVEKMPDQLQRTSVVSEQRSSA